MPSLDFLKSRSQSQELFLTFPNRQSQLRRGAEKLPEPWSVIEGKKVPEQNFVIPEDGATNALQLSKLHPDSAKEACRRLGFVPLPPRFAAMFNKAREDFARIENLVEDGLLTPTQARERKNAVLKAFAGFCREKGCPAETAAGLAQRLETGMNSGATP